MQYCKMMCHVAVFALTGLLFSAEMVGSSTAAADQSGVESIDSDPLATCLKQYNGFVLQAKKSLVQGDRNGAISYLLKARSQLGRCQEIRAHTSSPAIRLGSGENAVRLAGLGASSEGVHLPGTHRLQRRVDL